MALRERPGKNSANPMLVAMGFAMVLCVGVGGVWQPSVVSAQDQSNNAIDRYVKATVAMGCNAQLLSGLDEASKREKANDKVLKQYGYTRTSYTKAAFDYGADQHVSQRVSDGVKKCPREDAAQANKGMFSTDFRQGTLQGMFSLHVKGPGKVVGYVKGVLDGHKFFVPIRAEHLRGNQVRTYGRLASNNAQLHYNLRVTLRSGLLEGEFSINRWGHPSRRIPLRLRRR